MINEFLVVRVCCKIDTIGKIWATATTLLFLQAITNSYLAFFTKFGDHL